MVKTEGEAIAPSLLWWSGMITQMICDCPVDNLPRPRLGERPPATYRPISGGRFGPCCARGEGKKVELAVEPANWRHANPYLIGLGARGFYLACIAPR